MNTSITHTHHAYYPHQCVEGPESENQTNAGREMKIANNADNAGGKIKNDRETRLGHKTEYMTEKETAGVAN